MMFWEFYFLCISFFNKNGFYEMCLFMIWLLICLLGINIIIALIHWAN